MQSHLNRRKHLCAWFVAARRPPEPALLSPCRGRTSSEPLLNRSR